MELLGLHLYNERRANFFLIGDAFLLQGGGGGRKTSPADYKYVIRNKKRSFRPPNKGGVMHWEILCRGISYWILHILKWGGGGGDVKAMLLVGYAL